MKDDDAKKLRPIADHEAGLPTTVPSVIQSVGRTQAFAAGGKWGKMRAATAWWKSLTRPTAKAGCPRTSTTAAWRTSRRRAPYVDVDQLVTDLPAASATGVLPVAKTTMVTPVAKTNGLAQFVFGPVAAVSAIVIGRVARHQIKRPENRALAWHSRA